MKTADLVACSQIRPIGQLVPQLGSHQAALSAYLFRQPDWSIGEAGEQLRWGGVPSNGNMTGLRCNSPVGVVWIGLNDWAVLKDVLVIDRPDIPENIRLGLMESVAQPLIAALARLIGWPMACQEVCDADDLPEPCTAIRAPFTWMDSTGAKLTSGLVCGPVELLQRASRLRVPDSHLPLDRNLPAALMLDVGECELTIEEIRSLREGDMLRPIQRIQANTAVTVCARSRFGAISFAALVHKNRIRIENRMKVAMANSADEQPMIQREELRALPLKVKFELGAMQMTVGELSDLRSGQVIELNQDLNSAAIDVTVDGRLFARGELVAIGEELAIQITQMNEQADAKLA